MGQRFTEQGSIVHAEPRRCLCVGQFLFTEICLCQDGTLITWGPNRPAQLT